MLMILQSCIAEVFFNIGVCFNRTGKKIQWKAVFKILLFNAAQYIEKFSHMNNCSSISPGTKCYVHFLLEN